MEFKLCKPRGSVDFILPIVTFFRKAGKSSLLVILSSIISLLAFSQTNLSFTQIPLTDPDMNRPGGGAEQWIGQNTVNIPVEGTNTTRLDAYYRFSWTDFQSYNSASGSYDFTKFDAQMNDAITKGQKFSFGIMTICGSCTEGTNVNGYLLQYPLYLHNQMQAESVHDWGSSMANLWIPNWNSNAYLTALENLNKAINAHINSTSYKGVAYQNVIDYIDIRHYGNWGEWHHSYIVKSWADFPAGTAATVASLKRLIDAHVNYFPNFHLVILIGAYEAQQLTAAFNVPAEIGYYALTRSNNAGMIGWRRDNWGWTDSYIFSFTTKNKTVYNGLNFGTEITNRYKVAQVVGEPADLGAAYSNGVNFGDLVNQITTMHAKSFGNGNLDNSKNDMVAKNAFRAASKAAGYRLILESGSMSTTLSSGGPFAMTINWKNIGVAPTYENWNVVYELRKSDGTVVWTGTSAFNPILFSPQATATAATDNFTLGSVANGTYNMYMIVRDPNGYRQPLPLAITGRNADGSYLLRSNITVGGTANKAPVANAGSDVTIQLPAATTSLAGSGTDADGTISTYAWTKASGPAATIASPGSSNTSVTGLVQGVYVFTLTVTDNQGSTSTDNVQVTVNAAPVVNKAPVVNAGGDKTIQLPTASIAVAGSATDSDGSISTYSWTKVSGPASGMITSPAAATTTFSGLAQGVYVYALTATDNNGMSASDNLQITVDAAAAPANKVPIAEAGADQTITLPNNSANVNGTASSDPDGSIAAYTWTKISGPSQFAISNTSAASTIVNNLTAGVYSFQLKVTDNTGAVALDTVKIIVNAQAANQLPSANAGGDITITLPANIANLNGSASNDADGSITAFLWSQVSGPSTATLSSAGAAATTVSALKQGVYVFSLKTTDDRGGVDLDSVQVTVNAAPNQAPVANAGTSKSITLPTNSASLNGTASTDPDGTIAAYAWTQVSGPSTSAITGAATSTATTSNLVAGTYTYQLTVTDNSGAKATASIKITVSPAPTVPQPPVANAGADQSITLPTNSTTIDGSGSSASSGTIASYTWSEKSGPSTITLTNTAQNSITGLEEGQYVFYLTVKDGNGKTGTDSVIIKVNPAANQAPLADAGSSVNVTLPNSTAVLDGSKSYDPDGSIATYSWTKVSGPTTPTQNGSTSAKLTLTALSAGTYIYQLTVTDNDGATASAQVNVKVSSAANLVPVANAGNNQTITLPTNTVTLTGSASFDADGTIAKYSWTNVSGPGSITISNSATATPTVTGLQAGAYTFELTVTDNAGATAKDQVSVTVLPKPAAPNQAPVANAGDNYTITSPVSTLTLDGTRSFDPDGSVTGYSWTQVSGPSTADITGNATATPGISKLIVGNYIFQLTVTDNNNATGSDKVYITVNAPIEKVNIPPVADAGTSATITLPTDSYNLDAGKSSDSDGDVVWFKWDLLSGPNTPQSQTSFWGSNITVTGLVEGVYTFQVTVKDNTGAEATSVMTLTVKAADGGSQSATAEKFIVYPNPAHDVIHGRISSSIDGNVYIYVYDNSGKLVLQSQVEKTSDVLSKTFNISQLSSGLYTIQVNIANRKTMVTKFIKN